MNKIQQQLAKLGHKGKDRITGFSGVITSVTFDLYGCIQLLVNPGLDEKSNPQDQIWFDSNRIEILDGNPVMSQPDFVEGRVADGNKGPAEKPKSMKP